MNRRIGAPELIPRNRSAVAQRELQLVVPGGPNRVRAAAFDILFAAGMAGKRFIHIPIVAGRDLFRPVLPIEFQSLGLSGPEILEAILDRRRRERAAAGRPLQQRGDSVLYSTNVSFVVDGPVPQGGGRRAGRMVTAKLTVEVLNGMVQLYLRGPHWRMLRTASGTEGAGSALMLERYDREGARPQFAAVNITLEEEEEMVPAE